MENSNVQISSNYNSVKQFSLLDKLKILKRKADELNGEYHEMIEKLKFNQKDVEYMMNKIKKMECHLDYTLQNHRIFIPQIPKKKTNSTFSIALSKKDELLR